MPHYLTSGKFRSVIVGIRGGGCYNMPCLHVDGQSDIDRRIAIGGRRYVSRTNESLSFAITEGVTLCVIKKFYPEDCTGYAVQTALNNGAATTTDR